VKLVYLDYPEKRALLVKLVPQVYRDFQVLGEVQGTQENLDLQVHQDHQVWVQNQVSREDLVLMGSQESQED
jgi:hypothetical protein